VPATVAALSDVAATAGGTSHTVAVTAEGEVRAWGANTAGQVGDGTTVRRLAPVSLAAAGYAWRVATPAFSVAAGTYTTEKTVTVTVATPGAEIHYRLDGQTPTLADPPVAPGGSVVIDRTRRLTARAWKAGSLESPVASATYTLVVTAGTFSPAGGTYTAPRTVSLATTTPGAAVRYTTDGTTPNEASPP
jgi:hypothetical protein